MGVNPLPRDLVLTLMSETHKVLPRRTTTETGNRDMAQAGARFETYVKAQKFALLIFAIIAGVSVVVVYMIIRGQIAAM